VASPTNLNKSRSLTWIGALPKELATGAEGLFVPGEARDRIWLKVR
jgi:hypothetical protein